MSVPKMQMLRWICGHTRKDRIRNDDIRDKLGVAPIQEKLVQHRLRWFGHIQRRSLEAPVCILSCPENTRRENRSTEANMGGNNKKRFERIEYIQRACFG
jgi:hypothetical protein